MVDVKTLVVFGRLDWRHKLLLLETVTCLAAAGLAVKFLPFGRAILTGSVPLRNQPPAHRLSPISQVGKYVPAIAKRVPWRSVCLQQALAAQFMLRRRGVDARLHYGVANDGPGLHAHVWVTADDQDVVGGVEAATFKKVATYPAASGET